MVRFDVNNKEKALMDANKIGKEFGSRNTARRESFAGKSEALNALQVNFNCREGNEGDQFSECLQVTTVYLSTKLEGGSDIETLIWNRKVFESALPDPIGPNPAAKKGHATGRIRYKIEEGGRTTHEPEHGIWPSDRAVYQLYVVTARGTGEMGDNVQQAGPAQATENR